MVKKFSGKAPEGYQDFRRVLDRGDIDAIFAPTPDHWHPLMAILGCQAGKDVYVEKPASPTVAEGRAMVDAARRYGRIVQLGTQQRSMTIFQEAIKLSTPGTLGPDHVRDVLDRRQRPARGRCNPGPVPEGLDWDMWLGPGSLGALFSPERQLRVHGLPRLRPRRRADQLGRAPHGHRPLGHPPGSAAQRAGRGRELSRHRGVRELRERRRPLGIPRLHRDLGAAAPERVPGATPTASSSRGPRAQLLVDRNTFEVLPESLGIPRYVGEPERSWAHPPHHNNFFDSMRTRKPPAAEIEQGHRSTTPLLLAGIALKTRRKLLLGRRGRDIPPTTRPPIGT